MICKQKDKFAMWNKQQEGGGEKKHAESGHNSRFIH